MKLQALRENKQYPAIRKLLNVGMQINKDFDLDDLAWIASSFAAESLAEYGDQEKLTYLLFEPQRGFRGDLKRMEEFFDNEIEYLIDDDFADAIEDDKVLKKWLLKCMKEYDVGGPY